MSRGSRFVNVEAESSDEGYCSDEFSEDLDNFADSENADDYDTIDKSVYKLKTDNYRDKIEELERRYMGNDAADSESDDAVDHGKVAQSALLPTPTSPLLFFVRCKIGKEIDVVNKVIAKVTSSSKSTTTVDNTGKPASMKSIYSAVSKDGLKGYIYIESYKKSAVEEILTGIKNVSRNRISHVPFREMVDAINYKKEQVVSEYGRIRGGKYKGDLVQVVEEYESSVKVRVVPRLGQASEGIVKKKHNGKRQKVSGGESETQLSAAIVSRAPPQMFNPEEFRNEIVKKDGGYYYNRDFYRDGFLVKAMLKSNIDFNAEYTFGELSKFSGQTKASTLEKNTQIKVIKGDLTNLVGTVESINGNSVVMTDGHKKYEMNIDYIQKYYEVGEEVSYNGVNGIIVKLSSEPAATVATLVIHGCEEEVVADIDQLQKPILETKIFTEPVKPRRAKQDPLVNKTVRIKRGEFKGQEGIIRDVYKGKCRVLLNTSKCVGINLVDLALDQPRSHISMPHKIKQYQSPGIVTPGYRTPGYRTSSHMSTLGGKHAMTPAYQSGMTPAYHTGMTPAYNDRINGYEEAGTDWLNKPTSPYDGTVVMVGSKEYVVDSYIDGVFRCKGGKAFEKQDVKYVRPEKYEDAIILEGIGKGETGALVSIKGSSGSIRVRSGEIYEVRLEDISTKRCLEEKL